jgi:hypothetical protein
VHRAFIAIFASVVGSLFMHSASLARDQRSDVEQMQWLWRADAQRDLFAALARGDKRFVGVYGVASEVPGVTDSRLVRRFGVRFIDGTSDVRATPESRRLNILARDYARRYNKLLLRHVAP